MKKIHSFWKLIIVLILGIGVISVTAGTMKVEADPENPTGGGKHRHR